MGMRHLEASAEKLRGGNNPNRLIVSVESSFATAWLVPKLDRFRKENPQVTVLVDSSQEIVDLEGGDTDIAIRYGVKSRDDWVVHRLFDDLVFPACSPSLIAGPPKLTSLSDMANVPLIHWDMSQLEWASENSQMVYLEQLASACWF